MTRKPSPLLTRNEFASLRDIAKGPLVTAVSAKHAEKLTRLGLIAKERLQYFLTDSGKTLLVWSLS
jgi:hypothetical protein